MIPPIAPPLRVTAAATGNIAVTGDIFVSGRKINPLRFRENIAYVMQDDSLLATATPREALEFSANLRFERRHLKVLSTSRSNWSLLPAC